MEEPTPYVVDVALRWSDQDPFGHVNHAKVVTLLEDARTALLFEEAARAGVAAFEAGLLVATLDVHYRRPLPWSRAGVRVAMGVSEIRAASFWVAYRLWLAGEPDTTRPAVEAGTQLVPFDLAAGRPRRLDAVERTFLERHAG